MLRPRAIMNRACFAVLHATADHASHACGLLLTGTSADTWLEAMPRQVCLTPGGRAGRGLSWLRFSRNGVGEDGYRERVEAAGRKMHAALVAATLAMCLWQGIFQLGHV